VTKTFVAKPGDKWKRFTDGSGMVRYADNSEVRLIGRWGIDAAVSASSVHGDPIDLPTPDALAQLREWGYVVTGDVAEVKPLEVNVCLITESRVREIVAEMLAAKAPPPPDVAEPDWKGLLEDLVGAISDADIAHGGDGDTRTQQSNAWRKVYNSPALTAARTNGGGK